MSDNNEISWKLEYDGFCGKAHRWYGGDIEIEISESKSSCCNKQRCKTKIIGRRFNGAFREAILLDSFLFDTYPKAREKGNDIINTQLDHYRKIMDEKWVLDHRPDWLDEMEKRNA